MRTAKPLKDRPTYLKRLIAFQDKEPVKIITGIRRCGKSTLLQLMQQHLLATGVQPEQIIALNFESFAYRRMTSDDLYHYVEEHCVSGRRMYLFFDELQRIEEWETVINAFRVDFDCDIYITGSNAFLLSSEYATYLAGRYVEIKMLPLSFREFIDFSDYQLVEHSVLGEETTVVAVDGGGQSVPLETLFKAHLRYGGMPGIFDVDLVQENVLTLLDGIYSTVVVRDIMEREQRRDQKVVTNADLLRRISSFLADNVGNLTSLRAIGRTLQTEQRLRKNVPPAPQTVASYIECLKESYMFYEAKRFDIKGRDYLRTLGKYYIVDIGLRNYLLGFREMDRGHVLENIVYLELLRRGYDVAVGKLDTLEVDFVATRASEKKYIQVTESMQDSNVRDRELKPLQKINDNYDKEILSLAPGLDSTYDGISSLSLIKWLVEEKD